MELDVQIAHSVDEVGPELWDRLGAERPFASSRWYRFGETVLADNRPTYVTLYRGGRPVARATFWLRSREALPISSRPARYLVEAILRRWPLLLCQTPLAGDAGLILPQPPLREEALATIARVARDQARRHRVSFLAWVYLKQAQARYAGWPADFSTVELPKPGARLVIDQADFEAHLDSLSKSARKDYRRHRNRAADLGIAIKRHPLTGPLDEQALDRAMTLVRAVERRYHVPPDPWARPMLEHAYMVGATWLTAEVDGRIVGCGLILGDRGTQVMALLGRDYDVQYAYFQLFYEAIRCAIDKGADVLWGGSGSYRMKRRWGFELETENRVVFTSERPLLRWLGRWVAGSEESKVEQHRSRSPQ